MRRKGRQSGAWVRQSGARQSGAPTADEDNFRQFETILDDGTLEQDGILRQLLDREYFYRIDLGLGLGLAASRDSATA